MPRKQSPKKQSILVPLLIVEGFTEKNYITILKSIYRKSASITNVKGGGAKSVLNEAIKAIETQQGIYSYLVVWFDKDAYDIDDHATLEQVQRKGGDIYISQPCVEHWLLAHFQSINLAATAECDTHKNTLKKHIPNYSKNDCNLLTKYITQESIQTAIDNYPAIGKLVTTYFSNRFSSPINT